MHAVASCNCGGNSFTTLVVIINIGPINLGLCAIICPFIFLHHDVRMYDLYGPIVPEMHYSIL